jgi:hypothetical protein
MYDPNDVGLPASFARRSDGFAADLHRRRRDGKADLARTPDDIVAKVNQAANAALADPAVAERFANAGAAIQTSTPAEMAAFVAEESARWKKNLEDLGLAGTR